MSYFIFHGVILLKKEDFDYLNKQLEELEAEVERLQRENPDDDFKFVTALIELSMLLRDSKYLGDIGIDDIYSKVCEVDVSGDRYKSEFKDILKKLCSEQ